MRSGAVTQPVRTTCATRPAPLRSDVRRWSPKSEPPQAARTMSEPYRPVQASVARRHDRRSGTWQAGLTAGASVDQRSDRPSRTEMRTATCRPPTITSRCRIPFGETLTAYPHAVEKLARNHTPSPGRSMGRRRTACSSCSSPSVRRCPSTDTTTSHVNEQSSERFRCRRFRMEHVAPVPGPKVTDRYDAVGVHSVQSC